LINLRKDVQNAIKQEIKDKSSNPNIKQLSDTINKTYKYYITLLDNMALESRREINQLVMQSKDMDIQKLKDQILIRDKYIDKASVELTKKNVPNSYLKNIKSIQEVIKKNDISLPEIANSGNYAQQVNINPNPINISTNPVNNPATSPSKDHSKLPKLITKSQNKIDFRVKTPSPSKQSK
jgi:hypothetical protein